jgi:hypothetical protein
MIKHKILCKQRIGDFQQKPEKEGLKHATLLNVKLERNCSTQRGLHLNRRGMKIAVHTITMQIKSIFTKKKSGSTELNCK